MFVIEKCCHFSSIPALKSLGCLVPHMEGSLVSWVWLVHPIYEGWLNIYVSVYIYIYTWGIKQWECMVIGDFKWFALNSALLVIPFLGNFQNNNPRYGVLKLIRLFWGWGFPYISLTALHTACIGEYLHFWKFSMNDSYNPTSARLPKSVTPVYGPFIFGCVRKQLPTSFCVPFLFWENIAWAMNKTKFTWILFHQPLFKSIPILKQPGFNGSPNETTII